jgi:hypothetical protein
MTDINVPDAEFEDTMIASYAATTNSVTSTYLTATNNAGSESRILVQLKLAKRPRFIPFLGSAPDGNVANNGYTSESAISSVTAFAASPGLYSVSLVDRTLDFQDLGSVTYNKVTASPSVDWTTAGGMDDVEYGISGCNFDQTSANQEYDIPLGARLVRHAMFNETVLIIKFESGVLTVLASQETTNGNEVILRGRFSTRNRENGVRSRKFAVR